MNFKLFVNENLSIEITRLAIFDFDGTLAKVPERPNNWSGRDWWGNEDSLSYPYYKGEINLNVFDEFKKCRNDSSTKTIVLTGRRGVIAHGVRNVLMKQGFPGKRIIPDSNKREIENRNKLLLQNKDHDEDGNHEEYYSGDHNYEKNYPTTDKGKPDGTTIAHKKYVVEKLMNYKIKVIEFWDDREDHIEPFIQLIKNLYDLYPNLEYGVIHKVISNNSENATIIDIPIKKNYRQ